MLHCDFNDFFSFFPFCTWATFFGELVTCRGQHLVSLPFVNAFVCCDLISKLHKTAPVSARKHAVETPIKLLRFLFSCSINIRRLQKGYPPRSNTVFKKRWITSSAYIFTIMCIYVWGEPVLLHCSLNSALVFPTSAYKSYGWLGIETKNISCLALANWSMADRDHCDVAIAKTFVDPTLWLYVFLEGG